MVSQAIHAAHTGVGTIGNIIAFFLFLSPMPTFYNIWKRKAAEDFSPDPYLVTVLNCAFWVYYGIRHVDGLLIITINGFGLAIEIFYVIFYLIYASKNQRFWVAVKGVPVIVIVATVALALSLTPNPNGLIIDPNSGKGISIGVLCDAANIGMYVMPSLILKKVYDTKSVEYMPFFLSVFGLLNGGCWLAYGLLEFDKFIVISNGLGFVVSIIQVGVYLYYYHSYPQPEKVLTWGQTWSNAKAFFPAVKAYFTSKKNNKIDADKAAGGDKVQELKEISIKS